MKTGSGKTVVLLILALAVGFGGAVLLVEDTDEFNAAPAKGETNTPVQKSVAATKTVNEQWQEILPPYNPEKPVPPADRSIAHIDGDIDEDYAEEAHDLQIKLIDTTNGQPITEYCKLWITLVDDNSYSLTLFDVYELVPPRSAWPDETGGLVVKAHYYTHEDSTLLNWAETPIPTGYSLDCDLSKVYAPLNNRVPELVTLYFKPAPKLQVIVQNAEAEPVEGVQLLVFPTKLAERDLQSLGRFQCDSFNISAYDLSDTDVSQNIADDLKHWLQSPFSMSVRKYATTRHDKSGRHMFRDITAVSDSRGLAVFPNLVSGKWTILAFRNGHKVVTEVVRLNDSQQQCKIVLDEPQAAYVVVDVYWHGKTEDYPPDEGEWADFWITETATDPRLGKFMAWYADEVANQDVYIYRQWDANNHIRLKFRFTKAAQWLVFHSDTDNTITISSVLGRVKHYRFDLQIEEHAIWRPTFMLGEQEYDRPIELYRNGQLCGMTAPDDVGDDPMPWGNYVAYLPGGIRHEFLLLPGDDLPQVVNIPYATLRITVDETIAVALYPSTRFMLDGALFHAFLEGFDSSNVTTFEKLIPVGLHNYSFGVMEGLFRAAEGETVNLRFTKEQCSGLERLTVVDDSSAPYIKLALQDYGDPLWPEMTFLLEPSGGKSHISTAEGVFVVNESDTLYYLFAPAGKYYLSATINSIIPVSLPGKITLTDGSLGKAKVKSTIVTFNIEHENGYRFQCLNDQSRLFYFGIGKNWMPQGTYDLYVWRDAEIENKEVKQYAEYSINANGTNYIVDPDQLDWKLCREIEFNFQGKGDTLDGQMSWWKRGASVRIEDTSRHMYHTLELGEVVSLEPPIRAAKIWLADGEYQIVPWFGADAITFKVGADEPNRVIINSDK